MVGKIMIALVGIHIGFANIWPPDGSKVVFKCIFWRFSRIPLSPDRVRPVRFSKNLVGPRLVCGSLVPVSMTHSIPILTFFHNNDSKIMYHKLWFIIHYNFCRNGHTSCENCLTLGRHHRHLIFSMVTFKHWDSQSIEPKWLIVTFIYWDSKAPAKNHYRFVSKFKRNCYV